MIARRLLALPVALAACLAAGAASAHRVGLSQGEYAVNYGLVTSRLVFARDELGEDLDVVARTAVTAGGAPCPGRLLSRGPAPPDGVAIRMEHDCRRSPGEVRAHLGFLDELERGHRHVARVTSSARTTETLAYAGSADLALGRAAGTGRGSLLGFVRLGVEHILGGADHLLFLLGVLLLPASLRSTVLAVTAFTVAHSITLALAVLGVVAPDPGWVEPLIALSVAYVGVENLLARDGSRRPILAFAFGLVHGLGFAAALREIALPAGSVPLALAGFNAGVELGQLAVLVPVALLLARAREERWFHRWARPAASVLVAAAGVVWAAARLPRPAIETARAATAATTGLVAPPASRAEPAPREHSTYPGATTGEAPALVDRLCRTFAEVPRLRRAECTGARPGVLLGGECRRMLASAVGSGAVALDPPAADRCVAAFTGRYEGCEFTRRASLPPVPECASLFEGRLGAGATCRSSLECAGGLHCDGAGPLDTGRCRPPKAAGASCGLAIDPLASYVPSEAGDAHPECAGTCTNGRCLENAPR